MVSERGPASLLAVAAHSSNPIIEDSVLSGILVSLIVNQLAIYAWFYLWVLEYVPSTYVFPCMLFCILSSLVQLCNIA